MDSAIEIQNLSVVFPSRGSPVKALDGLNLTVPRGQVFGFLGPNGAGKTTAMHVLLGFIEATGGHARVFGEDVGRSIARQRLGYLPEHPDTYRFMTGRELLTMTGRLFLLRGGPLRSRVEECLAAVDLSEAADRRIATYSRGMMQRVCLAQALVNDPDLLILDEPTGGLDPFGRMDIRRTISRLRDRGKTVFFSSHELSEVELVCDSIAILAKGRVIAEGPAARIAATGERLEKYFMAVVQDAECASAASPPATKERAAP
jgi:ABC-2 type transport system ATP-binding protein